MGLPRSSTNISGLGDYFFLHFFEQCACFGKDDLQLWSFGDKFSPLVTDPTRGGDLTPKLHFRFIHGR